MTVFQRTGNWFLPRKNRPYPALLRTAFERVPRLQDLRRRFMFEYGESLTLMIRHPRTVGRLGARALGAPSCARSSKDPELREKVWPDYTFGCKRILFSSEFLPALERPNVELVTGRDRGDRAGGRRAPPTAPARARLHHLGDRLPHQRLHVPDGDHRARRALAGRGLGGAARTRTSASACPAFPNMFILYGPNTNTSGGSIIFYLETQTAYVRQALQQLRARGAGAIEVRAEVEAASDRERAAPLRRHRVDAVRLLVPRRERAHRRQLARLHARVPAAQPSALDPSEFSFAPLPSRAARRRVPPSEAPRVSAAPTTT